MRLLKINDTFADIDDRTAIGITFQKYDFKNIGNRQVSISNSFTLPNTAKNIRLFSYADNSQSLSQDIYSKYTVNYWIDNEHLIINGSLRVDEISDRIKVYVVNRDTFWDKVQKYTNYEMLGDLATFLREEKGIKIVAIDITESTSYVEPFATFLNRFTATTENLLFAYTFGEWLDSEDPLKTESNLTINLNGGHFCIYHKTMFEFFEWKFGVNFNINDTDTLNLFNDSFVSDGYELMPEIEVVIANGGFLLRTQSYLYKPPVRQDKKAYDYIRSFFQQFNVIIDDYYEGETYTMKLRRFDDIKDNADVVNFSGKLKADKIKFKPSIDGFGQISRIKYKEKTELATDFEGDKLINCNNENLDSFKELFEIDAYYPSIIQNSNGESILNLSEDGVKDTYVHLITSATSAANINVVFGLDTYAGFQLKIPAVYSITGEYTFIDEILAYPKFYEIEKWLTLYDILGLEFFKQYYIEELGGSFFINKISGFNPEKSNAPTKLELVKISDRTPKPILAYLTNFYVDGLENAYTDGAGTVLYDDWFLPSQDELEQMYVNLHAEGVGGFANTDYWSSTESSSVNGRGWQFDLGSLAVANKNLSLRVRACRAFTSSAGAYSLRDIGPAGGLIFYIDGTTYYEAAPSDQSTSQAWSNVDSTEIGTTGTAIGTGQQNTQDIINQAGHTDSAAKLCDEHTESVSIPENNNYYI